MDRRRFLAAAAIAQYRQPAPVRPPQQARGVRLDYDSRAAFRMDAGRLVAHVEVAMTFAGVRRLPAAAMREATDRVSDAPALGFPAGLVYMAVEPTARRLESGLYTVTVALVIGPPPPDAKKADFGWLDALGRGG